MNTQRLHKLFASHAGTAALLLRVPVGIILVAHGAQKLFGWFGGHGLAGTAEWMTSIGLQPGLLMALLAGGAEFFGGLALILGLLTRPAALVSAVTMVVAIFSVHISNGLFMANGGYEFALTLLAATAALTLQGGGRFALDNLIAGKLQ
ncbi:DoxD-like family protein [Aliidiomarina sedimenti]|uniref:DoxD-like family protein n=1 Tax=Aliidiomarina sedimenti TaxID=1933879 RepID=A0ABY0BY99_9GAMM|nr:DoxX family protein [Aliidiomarina sedimenti]RUO29252.1 DoxD-like family protein [Aliidiomarina sedimenti]